MEQGKHVGVGRARAGPSGERSCFQSGVELCGVGIGCFNLGSTTWQPRGHEQVATPP